MENPIKHIADAVEDRRLEIGLKKQDVATRAGVTPSYLRRVLNGDHPMSADVKAGLERALQWPFGYIDRIPGPRKPPAAPPPGSRYTQAEWDALDPSDRLLIADIQHKLDERKANATAHKGDHPTERRRARGA
jgi:transcriptional regulator with XRE-family HTH domain